ncbi:hypothetical protein Back11_56660 [Paenibacillus baekrokdamisoli]|uniref:Uncharacterized protein n=1 Tax=Paenibacillus baekrokdamisoli TaxID=1712516 RepID=A0A3G9JEI6_9BACL|nr:hypothetical protein [Paenibacillus baekrokdamisoli]MBB3073173.1 hypothetical protein [Paenibacillus baekrokdamisoli]BBH24321.1 hypothetical protein Back11_56660 [Paenibacillus baekrokdamisoli]
MKKIQDFDKDLWFTFKEHCKGKHFIVGNPHTFHGRISAYCPQKNVYFNVSLGEIGDMPSTTKYWIKGFLSGNEPAPPVDEEGDIYPPAHEMDIHWVRSIALFHKTGYWYSGDRSCAVCGQKLLNSWTEFECENCKV